MIAIHRFANCHEFASRALMLFSNTRVLTAFSLRQFRDQLRNVFTVYVVVAVGVLISADELNLVGLLLVVFEDDRLHDHHAETRSGFARSYSLLGPEERAEKSLLILGRHPDALIHHLDTGVAFVLSGIKR